MRRKFALAVFATLATTLVVGCGPKADTTTVPDSNTEVETPVTTEASDEETSEHTAEELAAEMAEVEAKSVEFENQLNDAQTQSEMNDITSNWYHLWDDELNALWDRASTGLSGRYKDQLVEDQRAWVERKEAAVDEAGNQVDGGSMEPMVRAMTAKDYTRARAYFLACAVAEAEGYGYEIPADVQASIDEVDLSLDEVFEKFEGQWIFDESRGACIGVEPTDRCDYGVDGSAWTVWVTGGDLMSDLDVVSYTDNSITFYVRTTETYYKLYRTMENRVKMAYGSTADVTDGVIGY